jgi:hypothetical protein
VKKSSRSDESNCRDDLVTPKSGAYADPPYLGQALKHYRNDPHCAEVDHQALIQKLTKYDGWALSCSTTSLWTLLPMCPPDVRIGAWVKTFCAFKKANPAFAWEAVLYKPCRPRRGKFVVRDWVAERITLKRGLCGVKPDRFSFWLFELLGLEPEDTLDDLFPGSGAVKAAWHKWRARELERRITGEPFGLYVQRQPDDRVLKLENSRLRAANHRLQAELESIRSELQRLNRAPISHRASR